MKPVQHEHSVEVKIPAGIKEKVWQIQDHFAANKKIYLTGIGCFAVGYILCERSPFMMNTGPEVIQTISGDDNIATVVNRSKNVNIITTYLNVRNYPANPVRCVETSKEWPSQTEAAEAMGILTSILSRHLNGKLENANGYHFERIAQNS